MNYQVFILQFSLEGIKHVYNIKKNSFFSHNKKMSSLKKIKNARLIKMMRELKNLEDAIKNIK